MSLTKVCSRCLKAKPKADFNVRTKSKDGLRHSCRVCDGKNRSAWLGRPPVTPSEPVEVPSESPVGVGSEADSPLVAPLVLVTPPKVIGRIGPEVPPGAPVTPRVQEVALGPTEEVDRAAAEEFSNLLNKKLSIRQRANLMVRIARNIKGNNAPIALKAINDINLATRVISKSGVQVEMAPLFLMPEGTKMKMGGDA